MSTAVMNTSEGAITIELFDADAPKTVQNFKDLVQKGFYDGLTFHRIIKDFMIQAGDPLGRGTGGPGYRFDDEIHPELSFNQPYKLAMANAGIQMGKGTNGSQFFITTIPTDWLQGKHTIFGEVADEESKKVVDAIEGVRTGMGDRPVEDVTINSIDIEQL